MIMSQVIALFVFLFFCPFPAEPSSPASTTSVLWTSSSNISCPSEEVEQAIIPINKKEAQSQREPDSLFCHCTGFTTRLSVKYGPSSKNVIIVVSNTCPVVCTHHNIVRTHIPQPANTIFNDLCISSHDDDDDFLLLELTYLSLPLWAINDVLYY